MQADQQVYHLKVDTSGRIVLPADAPMTKALKLLVADGHEIDEAALACFSPYQTEHLNRFGRYTLKRDRVPEPLDRARVLRMPPRSEGLPAEKIKTSVTF